MCKWEENIKIYITNIYNACGSGQRLVARSCDTIMNLQVLQYGGKFLTESATINFSKGLCSMNLIS
jgi:hypothetical protein